jgi:hypothetical protein
MIGLKCVCWHNCDFQKRADRPSFFEWVRRVAVREIRDAERLREWNRRHSLRSPRAVNADGRQSAHPPLERLIALRKFERTLRVPHPTLPTAGHQTRGSQLARTTANLRALRTMTSARSVPKRHHLRQRARAARTGFPVQDAHIGCRLVDYRSDILRIVSAGTH